MIHLCHPWLPEGPDSQNGAESARLLFTTSIRISTAVLPALCSACPLPHPNNTSQTPLSEPLTCHHSSMPVSPPLMQQSTITRKVVTTAAWPFVDPSRLGIAPQPVPMKAAPATLEEAVDEVKVSGACLSGSHCPQPVPTKAAPATLEEAVDEVKVSGTCLSRLCYAKRFRETETACLPYFLYAPCLHN